MIAAIIILTILLVGVIYLCVFKKDKIALWFGNSITSKVERQKKLNGEVEVLKKEQKVRIEETEKEFEVKENETLDSLDAQINSLKAQIKSLQKAKEDRSKLLIEEKKVAIEKVTNKYNRKIVYKVNQAKKLGYYIDAEQKNVQDVIAPDQPNAPTPTRELGFRVEPEKEKKILVEEKKPRTKKTSK